MGRLDNKVAIVTGAGMGIGRAVAIMFAGEGAKVVIADLAVAAGEETVRMIKEAGGEAAFVKADVSLAEDVKNMVKRTVATYGKLDVLYNNAGIARLAPLTETTDEDFERLMAVNVKGVWLCMKYVIPEMIKAGGGSIINVSSIAADAAQHGLSIYSASKGAVTSMSKVAALEYGPQNIRVNVIKPGLIVTPMLMAELESQPKVLRFIESETPLGKLGKVEEVATLAVFFASDESSHITGQKLTVDGGIEAASHIK